MRKERSANEIIHILLASNDAFLQESVVEILSEYHCRVRVVKSCKDALLSMNEQRYDFVIFDPQIRALDGAETVRYIKKMQPELPMAVISDESSFESAVKIAETGVLFRLSKPVDEDLARELVKTVSVKKAREQM